MPRPPVKVKRVDECDTLSELITHCFPAFGGAFLRRIYTILDRAIGHLLRVGRCGVDIFVAR
jgi:deoxyhypusine synthase